MNDQTELRRAFKSALVICGAMMAALLIYVAIVEILKSGQTRLIPSFVTMENLQTLRYIFYFAAAFMVILIRVIRGIIIRRKAGDEESALIRKLFRGNVVTFVMAETPAVLGLALFILTGFSRDFYILTFISLILMFMFFPRYSSWHSRIQGGFRS